MSNETVEPEAAVQEQQAEQIRLAAYYRWKEKGEPQGSEVEDWLEAEASVEEDAENSCES
jgi:hypothetical protein